MAELYHYGVKHRSGRYPYGSGDRPYQDVEGGGGLFKRKKKNKKAEEPKPPEKSRRDEARDAAKTVTKEEAMKTMSPTSLHAVRRELSDDELNRVVNRVRNEQTLEAQSENELRRHTSSSRSAIDAYRHRKEISDSDLEVLNKRLQEEQKLREFKNAEVERGKKFIKSLDKLNTYVNKGLDYYGTFKRVEKVFSDIDNADKQRRAAEQQAKQQKKEERAQKRRERAERRVDKQREKEDSAARRVGLAYEEGPERFTGTVEGEGRSSTSARSKYDFDIDYGSYTPSERTINFIESNSSTSLAVIDRRRR